MEVHPSTGAMAKHWCKSRLVNAHTYGRLVLLLLALALGPAYKSTTAAVIPWPCEDDSAGAQRAFIDCGERDRKRYCYLGVYDDKVQNTLEDILLGTKVELQGLGASLNGQNGTVSGKPVFQLQGRWKVALDRNISRVVRVKPAEFKVLPTTRREVVNETREVCRRTCNRCSVTTVGDAIRQWRCNRIRALKTEGAISAWDLSRVTNFGKPELLCGFQDVSYWHSADYVYKPFADEIACGEPVGCGGQETRPFNDDINMWKVSQATSLTSLFDGSSAFNQPLSKVSD